jgi:translation elongation factor EF-Tu-like GTPase
MNINEPWEAQLDWAEDCNYVFDAIDNQIAGPVSMDEAILVAAAPDLLAALEELLDKHVTVARSFDCQKVAAARAAIKKAKGE